jgi:hypothetical protein
MAELLIKATDAYHNDPVKDRRGCYKRGDPVVAFRDGWSWGRLETIPTFWRIRVAAVERLHLYPFCAEEYAQDYIWLRGHNAHKMVANHLTRRRWSFSPELIAPSKRMALFRGEIVNLTWAEFTRAILDKKQWGGRQSLVLKVA